jgi:hypothetical protein
MNRLKLIYLVFVQLVKQVWLLPASFVSAVMDGRQRAARNKLEAERLDRIRNPSKYLEQVGRNLPEKLNKHSDES